MATVRQQTARCFVERDLEDAARVLADAVKLLPEIGYTPSMREQAAELLEAAHAAAIAARTVTSRLTSPQDGEQAEDPR